MSGLENMKTRLNWTGKTPQQRMETEKLRTLRHALKYAYASETIVLQDGREFKGLINPDKLKQNRDEKILSIPFEDICLNKPKVGKTTEGYETIGVKPGDVIVWKETDTHWLVYMRKISEQAFFSAEIRRCRHVVTFGEKDYWVYFIQSAIRAMRWTTKQDRFSWNDLNYTAEMFVPRDEVTSKYFTRFTKIKIDGNTWEVVSSDEISVEGVILVYLREYFNNSIEDAVQEEKELLEAVTEIKPDEAPCVIGPNKVYPYEIYQYCIQNMPADGVWSIDNEKDARILKQNEVSVTIEIIAGKSDKFNLVYTRDDLETDILNYEIEIKSL